MTRTPPLAWQLAIAELPAGGLKLERRFEAEDRAALASHAGIEAIERLDVSVAIRHWAGGVEVEVSLDADVVQSCVVTLEPVRGRVTAQFVRRYLPGADVSARSEVEIAPEEEDPPEPLDGDTIDLGPALAEEFILALDPYPRAPGATLPPGAAEDPDKTSPFAILERLKTKT